MLRKPDFGSKRLRALLVQLPLPLLLPTHTPGPRARTRLAALEVPHEEGDEERREAGADHGPHALAEARRVRRGVEHELPPRVHDVVPHAVGAGGHQRQ